MLLVCSVAFTSTAPVEAHPLGNFSISHYTRLELHQDAIELQYVVDMAEIPTFQEIQQTGLVTDVAHPTVTPFLARKAETLKDGLTLIVQGRRVPLDTMAKKIIFPPGAGGLPTLKLAARYRGKLAESGAMLTIEYRDGNFAGRAGWKEIIAITKAGLELVESSVPTQDRSRELSDYPTDLLDSPPQTIDASLVVRRRDLTKTATLMAPRPTARASDHDSAPPQTSLPVSKDNAAITSSDRDVVATLTPNRQGNSRGTFTELIATRELGIGIVLFALIAAAGLGAFHALEPGHGKTLVAAYLVGSRGTAWHALVLGLVVTAAHTAGVYLLGAVTLYASRYVVPERLYPWLGVGSGLVIAGLGFILFLRRYAGDPSSHGHGHDHLHGHAHDHAGHAHGVDDDVLDQPHTHHDRHHHDHSPGGDVSLRALFALGITGGIVPCPAALVVLLSAISLNRVAFGLMLIVAFSLGLAAVLITIGLLIVSARRLMTRSHGNGPLVTRWLPLASSAMMTVLGAAIVVQGLRAAGVLRIGVA
jgi:ABC-type nickel/cobalt efflux system permease component RcnA